MIKRTVLFSTPGTMRLHLKQLVWKGNDGKEATIPIEDIGYLLIESSMITVSVALLQELSAASAAVIVCDSSHMPSSYMLPCAGHSLTQRLLQNQIGLSDLQKAMLWGQTIRAKIANQATVASNCNNEIAKALKSMGKAVKRGDPQNIEAQAARIYFSIFSADEEKPFRRDPDGPMPNAALNYGYAIVRAAVARGLVASGLNCALGIHHHNRYNPFCLADDIMEPYRPFVDLIVLNNKALIERADELNTEIKKTLLSVLTMDVVIGKMKRPLMNAISLTTASLARIISGEETETQINYPVIPDGKPARN